MNRVQKINVVRLAAAQALSMTTMNVNVINTALVGVVLAPAPWLATLPLSLVFLSAMIATLPVSMLMARVGRRPVFLAAVCASVVASVCLGLAVIVDQFALFCAGSMGLGFAMASAGFYRYAAADGVPMESRSKAISYVLAGGLLAAIIGPEIARNTVHLVPDALYAGCFLVVAMVQLLGLPVIAGVRIAKPEISRDGGRPIGAFLRMPVYQVGLVCSVLGFAIMSYMMTATPLQVVNVARLGHSANATIIQWHVVAMFAPSFFTGGLIARYGAPRILWAGVVAYVLTVVLAAGATGFWPYWWALLGLGLGWNFLFVGGSSLVASVAKPEERGRVQGFADMATMTGVALASLGAGVIHTKIGWDALSLFIVAPIAILVLALCWLWLAERDRAARHV